MIHTVDLLTFAYFFRLIRPPVEFFHLCFDKLIHWFILVGFVRWLLDLIFFLLKLANVSILNHTSKVRPFPNE